MTALRVDALDVPFGSTPGLNGVSFEVQRGERFAVVGASGAGKTSLLQALAGFVDPTGGRIQMDGEEVSGRPPERRPCVLLTQAPLLFPHLSVFENVAFPLRVRRRAEAEIRARVAEVLSAVRLGDFADRRPATLSGGQARRVALARAIAPRPRVLLLDEPLSALDPALREEMRRMILELQADDQPALVMVTHDLAEAGRIADRIGVLIAGRLEQVGTPEAVFRRPATLEVARFIGLRNEFVGMAESKDRVVVFGVDGGRIVPDGDPESSSPDLIPARVASVVHAPEGVTARLTTVHGEVELRVEGNALPTVGSEVRVRLRSDRTHIFSTDPPGTLRDC